MAGHSHWAGIKHKKGKADKERAKIFSKLSKEIILSTGMASFEEIGKTLKILNKIKKKKITMKRKLHMVIWSINLEIIYS